MQQLQRTRISELNKKIIETRERGGFRKINMNINTDKTKTMIMSGKIVIHNITIDSRQNK